MMRKLQPDNTWRNRPQRILVALQQMAVAESNHRTIRQLSPKPIKRICLAQCRRRRIDSNYHIEYNNTKPGRDMGGIPCEGFCASNGENMPR